MVKLKTRNLRIIKNAIKKHADRFDMSLWCQSGLNECGTLGCVAGFCKAYLATKRFKSYRSDFTGFTSAKKFLGLTDEQAQLLFYSSGSIWAKYHKELGLVESPSLYSIKAKHAVIVLENLASGKWNFEGCGCPE